jgi:hypothetical protein
VKVANAWTTPGDGAWHHAGQVRLTCRHDAVRGVEKVLKKNPDAHGARLTISRGPGKPRLEVMAFRS